MGNQERLKLSRRQAIKLGLILPPTAVLAACVPPPAPTATFVEKPTAAAKPAELLPPFKDWQSPTQEQIEQAFKRYHHPSVEGKEVPTKPYIAIPFKAGTRYKVDEGWYYAKEEYDIHKDLAHYGIDWSAEYGTPVYAPVDGYAMSSYQLVWDRDDRSTAKEKPFILYQGKKIGLGLGLFGMFYVPDIDRFIFTGHLSKCLLPYTEPVLGQTSTEYNPQGNGLNAEQRKPENLDKNPSYIKVKRGDLIGYVGTSGLLLGDDFVEYKPGEKTIRDKGPTWDEAHVHFEEFSRNAAGVKLVSTNRDPYGIYGPADSYPYPGHAADNLKRNVKEPILVVGTDGLPYFAA